MALPFDVEGPVRAEVFVVACGDDGPVLTGPDGPQAWHVQTHGDEHPMDEVRAVVERAVPHLVLFHSTSWRWDHDAVVLTFLAVVPPEAAGPAVPIGREALARSGATRAPAVIGSRQVLEHALRHLAWLAQEDDVVADALDSRWHTALGEYVPASFEQLEKENP